MKVEVIDKEKINEITKYPCLYESKITGNIILFTAAEQGIVLKLGDNNDVYKVGQHCFGLDMKVFKRLESKVILEND
jgi:hypothetical protein